VTQRLYLLRHAEAESWNPAGNDFNRPLSSTGINHAQLVSRWAYAALSPPDTVLCSPAKRTRETLAPWLSLWPELLAVTEFAESMYNASLNTLLTLAEDAFSYSEGLLMVGHNPGVEQLLLNAVRPEKTPGALRMGTGTLAVIEFPDGFKQGSAKGHLLQLLGNELGTS